MEYRALGKTDQKVSRLGFGGATAGLKNYLGVFDPEEGRTREEIIAAIHRALTLGVTYFDTAPGYGQGLSEQIFGEALEGAEGRSPRGEIFLATKFPAFNTETEVARSLEGSLKNLRRDSVDLLQMHGAIYHPDQVQAFLAPGGYLEQMQKLREEGLIRCLGFSNEVENGAVETLITSGFFDVIQLNYNLLFQHPYYIRWQGGTLFRAREQNMGTVSMRSVTSGIFQRWIKTIRPDDDFDYTPALLQFQFSNPELDVVLVGMRTAGEVEANAQIEADLSGRIDLAAMHDFFPHRERT